MKRAKVLTLIITLCLSVTVKAENPAGIVLYFKAGAEVYLLLADHSSESAQKRGWAAFGGGANEGESAAETAARETEEETRGYFSRKELLKKIESQEPVCDGRFALFFAEVDFVPALRVANSEVDSEDRAYVERGPYAWVPYSQIEGYLENEIDPAHRHPIDPRYLPERRYTDWFWPVWLRNIRIALESNALPWEQKSIDVEAAPVSSIDQ